VCGGAVDTIQDGSRGCMQITVINCGDASKLICLPCGRVLNVTELMNEKGHIINQQVNIAGMLFMVFHAA
jgi:hypothetical protein